MVVRHIVRLAAVSLTTLGIAGSAVGMAGATPYYHNMYQHHDISVTAGNGNTSTVNTVTVGNMSNQQAVSGNASVVSSTQGRWHWQYNNNNNSGNNMAATGNTSNSNAQSVNVSLPAPQSGTMPNTSNHWGSSIVVNNGNTMTTNTISVNNSTTQGAESGNATVKGGSNNEAISGNATNTNTQTSTVTIN